MAKPEGNWQLERSGHKADNNTKSGLGKIIVATPEGNWPFERSGHKAENNTKNGLGKIT